MNYRFVAYNRFVIQSINFGMQTCKHVRGKVPFHHHCSYFSTFYFGICMHKRLRCWCVYIEVNLESIP